MLKNLKDPKDLRDAMLSLMPTAGTLAGIAIGLAGFVSSSPGRSAATLADDLLLLSALGFLLVCYLVFFGMRALAGGVNGRLMWAIDLAFLAALTLLVFSGFVVVYEFM